MCRCEFLLYWQVANECFGVDADYEARLVASRALWEADFSEFCDDDFATAMELGMDESSESYCGSAATRGVPGMVLAVISIASLLRVAQVPSS